MTDLGTLLKGEREKSRLDLDKTAKILRVKKEYLEDLENGDFHKLPPSVYVKGFLRNYARLLGLNEKQIIRLFIKTNAQKELLNSPKDYTCKKFGIGCFNWVITPELFIKGASLLVFALVIGYFIKVSGSFSRPPGLEVWEPADNTTVAGKEILVKGKTEEGAVLRINEEEVGIREAGEFQTTIVLMEGINQIELKVTNKFGKENKKNIVVNYKSFAEENSSVTLVKKIKLKAESQAIFWSAISQGQETSGTLEAYQEKELEIKEETKIKVDKGNGVYFTENNDNLEIFGEESQATERVFFP